MKRIIHVLLAGLLIFGIACGGDTKDVFGAAKGMQTFKGSQVTLTHSDSWDNNPWGWGPMEWGRQEHIEFTCQGTVYGEVDLSIAEYHYDSKTDTATVTVPHAHLTPTYVDSGSLVITDSERGILVRASDFFGGYDAEPYKQAMQDCEDGIHEKAEQSEAMRIAEEQVRQHYVKSVNAKHVIVNFK